MTELFQDEILSIPNKRFHAILEGDVRTWLRRIPSETVDLLATSPPYWQLRSYEGVEFRSNVEKQVLLIELEDLKSQYEQKYPKNRFFISEPVLKKGNWFSSLRVDVSTTWDGEKFLLGQEPDYRDFIRHLVQVFKECNRILKPTGSMWINIADSTASGKTEDIDTGYVGIPERLMLALIDSGMILESKIIWEKNNHMPFSGENRFSPSWEYIYFFVKTNDYHFDLDKVRIPQKFPEDVVRRMLQDKKDGIEPFAKGTGDSKRGLMGKSETLFGTSRFGNRKYEGKFSKSVDPETVSSMYAHQVTRKQDSPALNETYTGFNDRWKKSQEDRLEIESRNLPLRYGEHLGNKLSGKNPGDFWTCWSVNTEKNPEAHFATYPEELVEIPLRACCKEGDVVLDPFSGSGTTASVARRLGMSTISIEINPIYVDMIKKRVKFGERTLGNVVEWVYKTTYV